jgi:hypothetical protein
MGLLMDNEFGRKGQNEPAENVKWPLLLNVTVEYTRWATG